MNATVQQFPVPISHLCPPETCSEDIMIADHEHCTLCPATTAILSAKLAEHKEWHMDFCECNFDASLAAKPEHRFNECHPCHHAGCGYIKTARFGQHLIRCCPTR